MEKDILDMDPIEVLRHLKTLSWAELEKMNPAKVPWYCRGCQMEADAGERDSSKIHKTMVFDFGLAPYYYWKAGKKWKNIKSNFFACSVHWRRLQAGTWSPDPEKNKLLNSPKQ